MATDFAWIHALDRGAQPDRDEPADPDPEQPTRVISRALPAALLEFLEEEKAEDRYASVPEQIRRAPSSA